MRPAVVLIVTGLLVFGVTAVSYAPYHTQQQQPQQPQAQTGDVKTQLKTAVTHAGFAAGGDSLNYVQTHLGHALNCLEGTKGKNFNGAWGHVCEGQGNGILVDLKAASGGEPFLLVAQSADALALEGVKRKDLATIRNAAKGVQALLAVISNNLK